MANYVWTRNDQFPLVTTLATRAANRIKIVIATKAANRFKRLWATIRLLQDSTHILTRSEVKKLTQELARYLSNSLIQKAYGMDSDNWYTGPDEAKGTLWFMRRIEWYLANTKNTLALELEYLQEMLDDLTALYTMRTRALTEYRKAQIEIGALHNRVKTLGSILERQPEKLPKIVHFRFNGGTVAIQYSQFDTGPRAGQVIISWDTF